MKNKIKTNLILLFVTLMDMLSQAQTTLKLQDVYSAAKQNYPLSKQRDLISKSKEYTLQNVSRSYFPQLAINGQATYQSAVTSLPINLPGVEVPQLSKDQYRLYAEVNQPLYDGGISKLHKLTTESNALVEEQKLEVELYKLKERVNQLFFGILLVDENLKQTMILKKDLQASLDKTESSIINGIALKSNGDILKAEMLKTEQRVTEMLATRRYYLDMLGMFMNLSLDSNVILEKPASPVTTQNITRPELLLFDHQFKSIGLQNEVLNARNRPKFNLFIQGGYGRPALNMLSNSFEPYYIGGIKMSWSLTGLYTLKNDKAVVDISRKNVDVQKEMFFFNTNLVLKQHDSEVSKFGNLLKTDDEIITLRTNIKNTVSEQLKNGVISSSDYLRELNAESQAREIKSLHEIQLLYTLYNRLNTTGE